MLKKKRSTTDQPRGKSLAKMCIKLPKEPNNIQHKAQVELFDPILLKSILLGYLQFIYLNFCFYISIGLVHQFYS